MTTSGHWRTPHFNALYYVCVRGVQVLDGRRSGKRGNGVGERVHGEAVGAGHQDPPIVSYEPAIQGFFPSFCSLVLPFSVIFSFWLTENCQWPGGAPMLD